MMAKLYAYDVELHYLWLRGSLGRALGNHEHMQSHVQLM